MRSAPRDSLAYPLLGGAEIGSRPLALRSCRAYAKYGHTAVIERADARFAGIYNKYLLHKCIVHVAKRVTVQQIRHPPVLESLIFTPISRDSQTYQAP